MEFNNWLRSPPEAGEEGDFGVGGGGGGGGGGVAAVFGLGTTVAVGGRDGASGIFGMSTLIFVVKGFLGDVCPVFNCNGSTLTERVTLSKTIKIDLKDSRVKMKSYLLDLN